MYVCVYLCMYVCVYVCMCVCMYVCMYIYICMYVYIYIYISMFSSSPKSCCWSVCVCVCVCMCVCGVSASVYERPFTTTNHDSGLGECMSVLGMSSHQVVVGECVVWVQGNGLGIHLQRTRRVALQAKACLSSWVCIYTYTWHTYVCVYVCMCVCMYVYMCVCVYVCV